jgi:FMN phosphatase YigB (HAD superfamily)
MTEPFAWAGTLAASYPGSAAMGIQAVFFDVGETLVNEARLWQGWAAYLRVSSVEFFTALDDVIARGEPHRNVFGRFRPGLDVVAARRERSASGDHDVFDASDLYADALPCLRTLRQLGYFVGIAGNQPREAEIALRRLGLEADLVVSSASWGVRKPNPEFFSRMQEVARVPAFAIAYVGDRLDHDVVPARDAGMVAILIERGPWGRVHARRPEIARAHAVVRSLQELPEALARLERDQAKQ